MTLRVSFEISGRDLRRFRSEMRRARQSVRDAEETDILAATEAALEQLDGKDLPDFITQRLPRLHALLDMLRDDDWRLRGPARSKILAVLVYFSDPEDLIPDVIPGLGLLDDAIMIELVLRDLKHDLEAYADFAHFRKTYYKRHKLGRDAHSRQQRLEARRDDLQDRAKRRRQTDREQRQSLL